jgi:hypothetical protein
MMEDVKGMETYVGIVVFGLFVSVEDKDVRGLEMA